MKEYLNATCAICGKKYHVCSSCENARSFTPWRMITDSSACYKIFMILSSYTNGYTSRQEAKEQLQSCDLTHLDTFVSHIRDTIQKLLDESSDHFTL